MNPLGQNRTLAREVSACVARLTGGNDFFRRYCTAWTEPGRVEEATRRLGHLMTLSGIQPRGAKILDAGCGFGLTSIFLFLLGAAEVHGVDRNRDMLSVFQSILDALPLDAGVLQPHEGDVSRLEGSFGRETFDLVFCHEGLSHFRECRVFLDGSRTVLKKRGALCVVDSNNARNLLIRLNARRLWKRFEVGPPSENSLGHPIVQPFRLARKKMIEREFPLLARGQVVALAVGTAGLGEKEIREAVRRFLKIGRLPSHVYRPGQCAFDPVADQYADAIFDPARLCREIGEVGFASVRAVAPFGGWRGGMASSLERALQANQTLVFFFSRSFVVAATN
jgi:SAM-dependent methyltransferase